MVPRKWWKFGLKGSPASQTRKTRGGYASRVKVPDTRAAPDLQERVRPEFVLTREALLMFQKAGIIEALQSYYRERGSSPDVLPVGMRIAQQFESDMKRMCDEYGLSHQAWIAMAEIVAKESAPPVSGTERESRTFSDQSAAKIARPLSKELLKRASLKVLSVRGPMHYRLLVQIAVPELLNIDKLSEKELDDALIGIHELERDGLLVQAPRSSLEAKMLTDRGRKIADDELSCIRIPSINIANLIPRDDLMARVGDDFASGDYEGSVFKAYRYLEEYVRTRSGQPLSLVGVELMATAFRPSSGVLRHPHARTDSEAESLHLLMRGAIGWFKNPSSHRTVTYGVEHQAAHAVSFANLLLDLVDECENVAE